MDIKKIIKEHHQAMIDNGFYDCPKCEGSGLVPGKFRENPIALTRPASIMCPKCESSGIDPNKNIGELLMLIVSELGEALEAHRNNRVCAEHLLDKVIEYQSISKKYATFYENCVKNSFEDEIADVFLRLFDLCGYLELDLTSISISGHIFWESNNVADRLRELSKSILRVNPPYITERDSIVYLVGFKDRLFDFCEFYNISIEKYIPAKMAYNETRPHKHGKEY